MNWISFLDLLHEIYKKDPPDLEKIQKKGLLAVKIAQVYALRVDFLPERTCNHLSRLYRSARSHEKEVLRRIFDEYIPANLQKRITDFSIEPLGSASVGQVHTAYLDGTTDIVIKIVKEDVKERFLNDVKKLRRFLRILLSLYPVLRKVADPMGILDHIEDYTTKELDLGSEVKGQKTLKKIYNEEKGIFDLSPLTFPYLYAELSNEKILISERIFGKTFDELLSRGELPYERLLDLFRIHGYYIFKRGIFHGDIHPGNIMLADNKIYFIDTSAIAIVPDIYRKGLFAFFDGLTQADYEMCVMSLHGMSTKKLSMQQLNKYKIYFLALYKDFEHKNVSEVSLTRQMMQTIKSAIYHGMEFETGMFPIIKSFMYLDGMVLKCNPGARLLNDMKPYMPQLRSLVAN
jgi:ubiquinone biosynthesis protein